MLVTVILFLRESLEAALLISILMAVSYKYRISRLWLPPALAVGLACAGINAYFLEYITGLFEGLGQELMNAGLLMFIVLLLGGVCRLLPARPGIAGHRAISAGVRYLFILAVATAITHEGAELSVYGYAFLLSRDSALPLVLGGIIGTGIGASTGAIIYYVLVIVRDRVTIWLFPLLLTLIAAGMSLQTATYLSQAGWLPSGLALWDTSSIVSEQSLAGQLLYALVSYEATPNAVQVGFYLATILCFILIITLSRWNQQQRINT